MRSSRRRAFLRPLFALLVLSGFLLLPLLGPTRAAWGAPAPSPAWHDLSADEPDSDPGNDVNPSDFSPPTGSDDETQRPSPAWEALPLRGSVTRLSTPLSGAFFALTAQGLARSDDGGMSWQTIKLPFDVPAGTYPEVAVTPTNHAVLYTGAPGVGVYRSRDGGVSWALIYPTPGLRTLRIAVSPADPNVLYVGLTGAGSISGEWHFLRSRDAGATFEQLQEGHYSLCGMGVRILSPDFTDPNRLYMASVCSAGRTTSIPLDVSLNAGQTFDTAFSGSLDYAEKMVGGQGSQPGRFYLSTNRDPRAGGYTLYRSDDGAGTWTDVLDYRRDHDENGVPIGPNVFLSGVAYDPLQPDHVWVGLSGDADGVLMSLDGGVTWADGGAEGLGAVQDMALGIDSQNLYLATATGLYRQRLNMP